MSELFLLLVQVAEALYEVFEHVADGDDEDENGDGGQSGADDG